MRRLRTIIPALSLLLLLVVLALWARSYAKETMLIESLEGRILFVGIDGPEGPIEAARQAKTLDQFLATLLRQRTPPREHRLVGFYFVSGDAGLVHVPMERGARTSRYSFLVVGIPYWFLALITAGPLARWTLYARMLRKRRQAGRCQSCGYDLRATPERCPECGFVPEAQR